MLSPIPGFVDICRSRLLTAVVDDVHGVIACVLVFFHDEQVHLLAADFIHGDAPADGKEANRKRVADSEFFCRLGHLPSVAARRPNLRRA